MFMQFTKEIVGEQQRMNLSQYSVLTNGPENRQLQKERWAPEGIRQICLTQTGDLAIHLLPAYQKPARVPACLSSGTHFSLFHVLHILDIQIFD